MSDAGKARVPPPDFRFGVFVLQPAARRLLRDGEPVACPKLVFDLLLHLIEHRDRAVGRDELAAVVWRRADVADVQIGQVVLRARRAVDDDGLAQHSIATVPGFGYHWVAATEAVPRRAIDGGGPPRPLSERYALAEDAEDGAAKDGDAGGPRRNEADVGVPVSAASMASPAAAGVREPVQHAVAPPADVQQAIDKGRAESAPIAERHPPKPSSPLRTPHRVLLATALCIVVALVAALVLRNPPAAEPTPAASAPSAAPAEAAPAHPGSAATRVVLLPLRVEGRAEHAWLRLGGMDLVAERLRAAGLVVPVTESVLAALRTAGDGAEAQRVALQRAFGEAAVVDGEAIFDADGTWRVRLAARSDDGQPPRAGSAQQADAVTAATVAADALAAALGGTPPDDGAGAADADADWRRARAALLANETEVARRIIAGSSQLAERPAERAVHLAQVDVREGRLAEADTAMTQLLATLPPGQDDAMRAQALILRGSTRSRLADFEAAWRDFDAALQALPADAPAIERARALSGRGSSAVPTRRFEDALADMGQSRSLFAAAGDVFGTARVDANLGMLELYRARPASALEPLDAAADRLHAFGAQHEWQVVLTAQVQAHGQLLQHEAAAAVAEHGWAQRARSRDPEQRSDIALNRAQVLLATGRLREAAALLGDAQLDAVQGAVLRARVAGLRARLALLDGRHDDAARLAQAALAAWPAQGAERDLEPVTWLAVQALLAAGDAAAAAALAEPPPSPFALPDDLAYHELARGAVLAARGDTAGAAAARQSALDAAGQGAVPATLVAVAADLVPALLADGRLDDARAIAGRIAPWALRDFDCALVQVRVLHAAGDADAWRLALDTAQGLAGERAVPADLVSPP